MSQKKENIVSSAIYTPRHTATANKKKADTDS